jgi:hypothetical protein
MTLLQLKNQLKKKLEKSKDPGILRTALLVLAQEDDDTNAQRNLVERVAKAEKDYADGRTMTIDEARRRSKKTIGELYTAKRQRAKRA